MTSPARTTGQRPVADRDHLIRIDREGTAHRWVKSIGRTDAVACTVTFEAAQARRFSEATARKHVERLQPMAQRMRAELVVHAAPAEAKHSHGGA